MGRFIVLVVDGLGIGAMEDVKVNRKEDIGANTLKHVFLKVGDLKLPNLERLGIMNALDYETKYMKKSKYCTYGICGLNHPGADSFLAHQEIMGRRNFKGISKPFSHEIDAIFELLKNTGYNVDYILKHKSYKALCVDNSVIIADSLEADKGQIYSVTGDFNKISYNEIIKIATIVRKYSKVSRVTVNGSFVPIYKLKQCMREEDGIIGIDLVKAKVYEDVKYKNSNLPFYENVSEQIQCILPKRGIGVTLIGKAGDIIYNPYGKNIIKKHTKDILNLTLREIISNVEGFTLINVQGTDIAGHIQNPYEYSKELTIIDKYLGEIMRVMTKDDVLVVTGDHGNDPTIGHSRHTREYVPLLIHGDDNLNGFIGSFKTLSYISSLVLNYFY